MPSDEKSSGRRRAEKRTSKFEGLSLLAIDTIVQQIEIRFAVLSDLSPHPTRPHVFMDDLIISIVRKSMWVYMHACVCTLLLLVILFEILSLFDKIKFSAINLDDLELDSIENYVCDI